MPLAPGIDGFSRLITAIDPWLDRVVIVGGWAHRLYHLHPAAQHVDFPPLMTLDADVALPRTLPKESPAIRDALAAHGFQEEFHGDDTPPLTLYHLTHSSSGFYAEFLTPLAGSEYTRSGKKKATARIAGVNSQQLRHIELLLTHPWTVALNTGDFEFTVPKREFDPPSIGKQQTESSKGSRNRVRVVIRRDVRSHPSGGRVSRRTAIDSVRDPRVLPLWTSADHQPHLTQEYSHLSVPIGKRRRLRQASEQQAPRTGASRATAP